MKKNPCSLCSNMKRGTIYNVAKALAAIKPRLVIIGMMVKLYYPCFMKAESIPSPGEYRS